MFRIIRFSLLVVLICSLSGCFILNPYSSEFNCPLSDNGKCVDIDTAYKESMTMNGKKDKDGNVKKCPDGKTCEEKKGKDAKDSKDGAALTPDIVYQQAMQKKLTGLIEQPATPIIAPPTVLRVLLLPYKGDENELYMMRYAYIMADTPKWVLGDYIIKEGK